MIRKRMGMWALFLSACLAGGLWGARAESPAPDGWELVYADDFERDEVGPAWFLEGGPDKDLRIIDGELVGMGAKASLFFAYPVAGDQKVVYEARWIEGTGRIMTQHAPMLKASTWGGRATGVSLVHGRNRNSQNTIELFAGRRLARNDGPLPEPGVSYQFEAVVEGSRAYLKRDGELVIEAKMPFPLEGPDHQWITFGAHSSLRYDSIRIYSKPRAVHSVPAVHTVPWRLTADGQRVFGGADPEGRVAGVLATFRAGDEAGALAAAREIAEPQPQLDALLVLAAEPQFHPYHVLMRALTDHLRAHPELDPAPAPGALSLRQIADLLREVAAGGQTSAGSASYLRPRLDPRHVLYDPLLFLHGRQVLLGEGTRGSFLPALYGAKIMQELVLRVPTEPLYRMYLGERLRWGDEFISTDPVAPAWARLTRETHARLRDLIAWWFEERQAPDGQLGGGWGDDVEALRAWAPVLLLTDGNEFSRAGMRRLVDGAWEKAEGGLELGYSKRLWDVEHSAEPTGDTQPLMLAFEPEDAMYVERNRLLLGLTTNIWTVLRPEGRYFKNVTINAFEADDAPEMRAYVPYHTRAFKGMAWLAWRGGHEDVDQVWLELADTWVAATLREADGKLAGVVPAAVDPETGALGSGRGNWYRPDLIWGYYNWGRGVHAHAFGLLAAAFLKTDDVKYVDPIFRSLEQALAYDPVEGWTPPAPAEESGARPSAERQRYELHQWHQAGFYAPYLLAYRTRTGDTRFDAYLAELAALPECSPLVRFQITGHPEALIPGLERDLAETLRYNRPMLTSEVRATDDLKRWPGPDMLYTVFTGAWLPWGDSFWPTHSVTWSHPTSDWAALTRQTGPGSVDIRFWNFDADNPRFGLLLWRNLPPGTYTVTAQPTDGAQPAQVRTARLEDLNVRVDLELPAHREYFITIRPD